MRKRIVLISRALVGKSLKDAIEIAKENGYSLVVVEVNDIPLDYTSHLRQTISVSVYGEKIARIVNVT